MNNPLRNLAIAVLALGQFSCAAGNLTPLPESMPAARAALRPEHRIFYDTLQDYGEWVLIEPYGYVFRPRVNFDIWRPYGDGFWVPTDLYGWVWVSTEPFGWATYHYGRWLYDSFQGWVWIPGVDWAPAWVSWQAGDNYIGWAPLTPPGFSYSAVPGGAFNYVSVKDITATDLSSRIVPESDLRDKIGDAKPVENMVKSGGVTFNRGPRLDWIERTTGPLQRARIEDLVPAGTVQLPQERSAAPGKSPSASDQAAAMKVAAERATTEARRISQSGTAAPGRLPLLRPFGISTRPAEPKPAATPAPRKKVPRAVEPDSTRK